MILIEYIEDQIEGEPGPNFLWKGQPEDFMRLVVDLHSLGTEDDLEVLVNDFGYINVQNGNRVVLKSSLNGKTLVGVENNELIIDLDKDIWREVLHYFLSVSFCPSHNFVEFDNLEVIELGNFIISSEAT